METKKRNPISDYTKSLLQAEIINRCPICGKFEETTETFTNHHINGNSSISEYWNLIRICQSCHDIINRQSQDGKKTKKIKQIKKDLFRKLIGDASYQALLLAKKHKITSTLTSLGMTLVKMNLVKITNKNVMNLGEKDHPTIIIIEITNKGKKFIEELNIKETVPI